MRVKIIVAKNPERIFDFDAEHIPRLGENVNLPGCDPSYVANKVVWCPLGDEVAGVDAPFVLIVVGPSSPSIVYHTENSRRFGRS